jgi:hypothetical protein
VDGWFWITTIEALPVPTRLVQQVERVVSPPGVSKAKSLFYRCLIVKMPRSRLISNKIAHLQIVGGLIKRAT